MAKQGTAPAKKTGASKKVAKDAGLALFNGKHQAHALSMARALGIYGLKAADIPQAPADLMLKLRSVLKEKLAALSDDDKIKCAECDEVSTEETDFCPFCGDKGEMPDAVAAPAAAAPAKAAKAPKAAKEKSAPAPAPEAKTDLAIADAEQKLTARLERITQLKTDVATNSYDLGLEIRAINEEELWKARGHKSFKDFVEVDLGMSRALAYRLMDVVAKHTRDEFALIGSTKLALISSIKDEEERTAALEEAKQGASTRTIETRAKAAKGKAPPAKESEPAPKKKPNEITLLAKVNGKATLHQWRSAGTGRPLAKHKDDAYVEVSISEDVRLRVALKQDKEGGIIGITTQFLRVEAEAAE